MQNYYSNLVQIYNKLHYIFYTAQEKAKHKK